MSMIADLDVVKSYQNSHKNDNTDKIYPNLMLLRSLGHLHRSGSPKTLDYGCGYGANTVLLSSVSREINFADTCPIALSKTESKLKAVECKVKYSKTLINPLSKTLPFEDEDFDLIVCASLLSLLSSESNIRRVLFEFRRILSSGGMIFMDINGPQSEFAVYSENIGAQSYIYRGRRQTGDPIKVFCPKNIEMFESIASDYFSIVESGQTSHELMGYREQEFILICTKL